MKVTLWAGLLIAFRVPSSKVEGISAPLVVIGLTDLLNPRLSGTLGTRTNKNSDGDSEHVHVSK